MSDERAAIAIVGMGCRFPRAAHLADYWDVIRGGRICAGPVPRDRWNHDLFWSRNGAREANKTYSSVLATIDEVRTFAPEFFGLTPRRAKVMDPQQRLFLDAVRMALEDAGYAVRRFPRDRTGVFVGATVSDFTDIITARVRTWQLLDGEFGRPPALGQEAAAAMSEDLVPMQAYSLVGSLMNMVAANVNQCFDLGGPSFTTDAACSSALVALHEAVWQLRTGLIDAALVGGVYLNLTPDNLVAFARVGALSPTNSCRPYDGRADGFFIGEGIGAVMIRRLDDALAAGDRIYAVIRGVASNSDGKAEGPMTPRREGQVIALDRAYQDAGVSPRTVGFLEGHGTATPVGDVTEIAAFRDCLGAASRSECAVTSVKANIGHTMSAAGIAGLIKAALCVRHRTIPPQAGFDVPRPELELDRAGLYVPREARAWAAPASHPRRAGVNAFGFGGTNVHVVLEEPPSPSEHRRAISAPSVFSPSSSPSAPKPHPPHLVLLSAPTPALLARAADALASALPELAPECTLADVAYTLASRRVDSARLALVVDSLEGLGTTLRTAADALRQGEPLPAGVIFADAPRAPEARRLAFLFPGQGAQNLNLCRDLYQRFPAFRAELDRLAAAVDQLERPLLAYLYPNPTDGSQADATAALTATQVCQPAVAAVSLALARFVRGLGVEPEMVLGHSLGEFSAAAAAGLIADDAACVRFVATRGRQIADATTGEPGAMSAAATDAQTVDRAIADLSGVVLANLNHPHQSVISGFASAVAQAESRLAAAGVRTTRLRVSHAFHSPLMAPLGAQLAPHVQSLPLGTPRVPVVSAIRPGLYPRQADGVREIFLEHATSRVDFAAAIDVTAAQGASVFVQVGAGSALGTMAIANLDGRSNNAGAPVALGLTGADPDDGLTFLRTLGQLYALGIPVDLTPLFDGTAVELVPMLPPSLLESRRLWPVAMKETMDSKSTKPAPVAPTPNEGAASADAAAMATLFQQQMAVIDAHLAIMRQQNELLARTSVDLPGLPELASAAVEASAPAPKPANGHTNGHAPVGANGSNGTNGHANGASAAIEAKVIEVVSRITAHPPAKLKPTTRLGADLGFDSLMVVELVSGLQEAVPEAEPLPRSLFVEDATIADIARHVARALGSPSRAARPASGDESAAANAVRRYQVALAPRPLANAVRPLMRPIVILPDSVGLAPALAARLVSANQAPRLLASAGESIPPGALVVDLRAYQPTASTAADPVALRACALTALRLARRLDAARPAALIVASAGIASAGLPGFARALSREWPEVTVRSIAFEGSTVERAAGALAAELAAASADPEVVYRNAERLVPILRPQPLPTVAAGVSAGTTVVISGGGAGLGARLALALAERSQTKVFLLGRRPAGPQIAALLADIAAAGGQGRYRACDVRDPAAVHAALAEARAAFGPIQMAVHAAGLMDDAPVARKDDDAFAQVFDTKVAGALVLWQGLKDDPLTTFLVYGSWAGRFGNAHQTDYAAANGAVGTLAAALADMRRSVRVVTLDLPPWEGSHMLARVPEAIRRELKAQGVPFLDDSVGLDRVLAELAAAGAPSGEVLLGGELPESTTQTAIATRLSLGSHPWLEHHKISGRAVLPMAAALELLRDAGVAARPDLTRGSAAFRDLGIVRAVILGEDGAEVVARASAAEPDGEISVELLSRGVRAGLSYQGRLAPVTGWLAPLPVPAGDRPSLSLDDFYGRHTFHGPRLRAVEEVTGIGPTHVTGMVRAGQTDADAWLLAIDGALQLCAYWAVVHHDRVAVPVAFGEMRFAAIPAAARLLCRATLRTSDGDRFEGDLDLFTPTGEPVVQLRGLRAERLGAPITPAEIDPATFTIDQFPEVKDLRGRLDFAAAAGIEVPYFRTLDACTGATALIDGREHINFTSYNYVGLAGHPRITQAVAEAVERYGSSVSASRVTGGQKPIHAELEQEIANFLGCEAALVMVGGHATNVSVIGHLLGPDDLVLHDSLAHDSILGGARLAGARRRPFTHNDPSALESILREVRSSVRRVLIAVEGVYSMDGDITPLPAIVALKKKFGALLFVDEAHSLGVLGASGRGVGEHFGPRGVARRDVDIWMGTMSKTLASCGGYVAGSRALVEYLKYTTPGFIYSVGITPANAAAALTSLRILQAEPERAQICQSRARTFLDLCRQRGVNTGDSHESAVVPCIVGNSYASIRLAEALLKRGVHVHPIVYPAVAESMARLRFFITAAHSEDQLRHTADVLAEELGKLQLLPSPRPTIDGATAMAEQAAG